MFINCSLVAKLFRGLLVASYHFQPHVGNACQYFAFHVVSYMHLYAVTSSKVNVRKREGIGVMADSSPLEVFVVLGELTLQDMLFPAIARENLLCNDKSEARERV